MRHEIRPATQLDAQHILAIYSPIVSDTVISFELIPPTVSDIRERIGDTMTYLPWLVSEVDGKIIGYAYANKYRKRAAYSWSVEVSAYIHADMRRSGMGRMLYQALFDILELQGLYNAFAGIALPNEASIGFHEALGFEPIGIYRSVGHKFGAWHDVGWWQLQLQPPDPSIPPKPPLNFQAILNTPTLYESLLSILARINEAHHLGIGACLNIDTVND